ncbi:MAG: MFS transporter, partial [Candidatus Hodarchaeota archaeon]
MPLPMTGRPQKLAYSMGNIGLTGFLQLVGTFLLFFLIDKVLLNPWLASLVFLFSYGIWNGINDQIIGSLSARYAR